MRLLYTYLPKTPRYLLTVTLGALKTWSAGPNFSEIPLHRVPQGAQAVCKRAGP